MKKENAVWLKNAARLREQSRRVGDVLHDHVGGQEIEGRVSERKGAAVGDEAVLDKMIVPQAGDIRVDAEAGIQPRLQRRFFFLCAWHPIGEQPPSASDI
jgi:hypothetical protein